MKVHKRLGEILVEAKKITRDQLRKALSDQSSKGKKIGEKLVSLGYIDEGTLYSALSRQLKIPIIPDEKFKRLKINPEGLELIPQHFAQKNLVFPIQFDSKKNSVSVAMMDPTDNEILKEIKILCQTEKVKRYLAQRSSILNAIEVFYGVKGKPTSSPQGTQRHSSTSDETTPEELNQGAQEMALNETTDTHSRARKSQNILAPLEATENTAINPEQAAEMIAQELVEENTAGSSENSQSQKSIGRISLKKKPVNIKINPDALVTQSIRSPSLSSPSMEHNASSSPGILLENRVLLIDDHTGSRSVAEQILMADGYEVSSCGSLDEASQSLKNSFFDLILVKSSFSTSIAPLKQLAMKKGNRQSQFRIISSLSKSITGQPIGYNQLSQTFFQTVDYLISLLERKNPDQRRYAYTIAKYSRLIAQRLNLTPMQIDEIYFSAYLHDIWKNFEEINEEDKAKDKDDERRDIIEIFSDMDCPYQIVPIIKHIGEFFNGSGKPDGLIGEKIPVGSRIISVVRAFEGMLRSKIIKGVKEIEKISKLLRKAAGKKFDPQCVEAFVGVLEGESFLETTGVAPILEARSDILLADKDPQATSLIELRLINEGYSVKVVRDGQEAWDIIQANPPSMIIADVVLPKIDGFNLCDMVKSNEATQSIPFIFVSSRKDDFNMTKGLELGADDYQTKPVNVPFLITKARKIIETQQTQSSNPRSSAATEGVAGNLAQMGLVEIIQILGGGAKTAFIQIKNSKVPNTADLYMERGRIVSAVVGDISGEDAFYHIMTWSEGSFTITPDKTTGQKNINNSNDFLLLEAMRRMDESKADYSAA